MLFSERAIIWMGRKTERTRLCQNDSWDRMNIVSKKDRRLRLRGKGRDVLMDRRKRRREYMLPMAVIEIYPDDDFL